MADGTVHLVGRPKNGGPGDVTQAYTGDAQHVTVKDSSMGPEGAAAGNVRTFNGASAQTAAITGDAVDVAADSPCWIEIGSDPTAVVNTSYYMTANTTYRFPITSGNKIAAIDDGTTGNLYYHPVQ